MNGFRALQDLSHILPVKSLQHETHVPTIAFKRCLSNFLNSFRKQKNAYESRTINLSTVSNSIELIFTTWMTLPEITTIFNSRLSTYFWPVKTEIMRLEALRPLIKYDALLDENPTFRSKYYKMLPNIQTGDFGFVYNDNTVIKSDEVCYDDCISKVIFTFQENQRPRIDRTIEQVSTGDLSTCTIAKNVNCSSLAKPELKTPEIQQQQSRNLFKTLQQLNTITKIQKCSKDAAKPFALFSKIGWPSMERSYLHRIYHTSKLSKIKNNAIKCNDYHFLASDIRTMRQKRNVNHGFGWSRFDHLIYSGSSGNQRFGKSSLCLSSVPRRGFSSRSCTVIQQSIREIKNLRSTRSHPDRFFLAKRRPFSSDSSRSRKSADCDCENDKSQRSKYEDEKDYDECSQEIAKSRCQIESKKICGKTRRKDTYVSSQDDTCKERQQRKSNNKSCKSYMCPELKKKMPCTWDAERCSETHRKCDAKDKVSSRDCARQSKDSNCSQDQSVNMRCKRQSKSYERREDCEKSDEPRAVCKDSIKERKCALPKCEEPCKKRNNAEKERQKCTGNSRKRSNSCRKGNSSRNSDKSCNKINRKRRYSQQAIFSVLQDRKSFSTLIPDSVLGTNISKTTQRFYASCSKDEKDREQSPFCEKPKRKCETKEKDEIKKKCVKGPAKCISRKKPEKTKICQSVQKETRKKSCESTKKSNREQYCTNRKKKFIKDEKLKAEPVKADKKPKELSIKEQIDRERKEIDECKKGFKKEKKDDKAKMVSIEYKPTGLDCVINSCKEQQKKDSEKFASMPNESIISTDTMFKWFNIRPRVINGKIPIVAKDVGLFNMFDRSFSTAKLDYQDDFAIERTTNDDKIAQKYSANSDDFIHDDELPNYIEIEYEADEDDAYDWATSRSVSGIECKSRSK